MRVFVPQKYTSYTNIASIFWGFYESAELRLINKYLSPALPVIELGGSLGIVTAHIVSKLYRELVSVEANPHLIEFIYKNAEKHNFNKVQVEVMNKAISYSAGPVLFNLSDDNTASAVKKESDPGKTSSNVILVDAISLSSIASKFDAFTLVCDIEGSEVELLKNDPSVFTKCYFIFMEVHQTEYMDKTYNRNEIIEMLENLHFRLIERVGNVVYMENMNSIS